MKLDVIIKRKRLEQNLTQEQVAQQLGVSTPAVNKWEKGVSYPDISLLSPLARLLQTDLNTLLSFQEELTEKEIADCMTQAVLTMQNEGYELAFANAMDKIREYSTCDKLILNLALTLDGGLSMYHVGEPLPYTEKINALYEQCANSETLEIKNQAMSLLIHRAIAENEYETAQAYIDLLPTVSYDKKQLQGNLYLASGAYEQAATLFERKLLEIGIDLNTTLLSLMELALKEGRNEEATYLVGLIEQTGTLYEVWDYNTQMAYFQMYSMQKDAEGLIETIGKMLPSLQAGWDLSKTRLYRHIPKKQSDDTVHKSFFESFLDMLRTDADGSLAWVKDNPKFLALLERYST